MIFTEGDLIEVHHGSSHHHHPSWDGRRGIVVSYNGPSTSSWDGSWNCEMEHGTDCYFFADELTLILSHEERVAKYLGDYQ